MFILTGYHYKPVHLFMDSFIRRYKEIPLLVELLTVLYQYWL